MNVRTPETSVIRAGRRGFSWAVRVRARLFTAAARLRADLTRSAMNRRVVHRLSVLSDRELKDIGLIRQDVLDAGLPENGDATDFLLGRRDASRHRRRGPIHRR